MESFSSYDDGLIFVHSFDILIELHLKSRITMNYQDFQLIIPAIVNGAFACELFMKSLLSNSIHEHNLKKLFLKLEEDDKNTYDEIISNCIKLLKSSNSEYNEKCFMNDLEMISNAFIEFRYFYETKSQDRVCNIDFISALVKTLKIICERKFGKRPINTD